MNQVIENVRLGKCYVTCKRNTISVCKVKVLEA